MNATQKRRWLRFSLRAFLVLLTVGCVWLGVVTVRVQQQRQVVRWIIEHGGTVTYDYQVRHIKKDKSQWTAIPDAAPPAAAWLCKVVGIDCFSDVIHVQITSGQELDVTPLARLEKLTWLNLRGTPVVDVRPLTRMKSLKWLMLTGSNVSKEDCLLLKRALPDCVVICSAHDLTTSGN